MYLPSEPLLICKGEGSSRVKKRKLPNFEAFIQRHVRQKQGRQPYELPGRSPLVNVVNSSPPKVVRGEQRNTSEDEDKGQSEEDSCDLTFRVRELERKLCELEERLEQRKADMVC
jgi:hypothetical protein